MCQHDNELRDRPSEPAAMLVFAWFKLHACTWLQGLTVHFPATSCNVKTCWPHACNCMHQAMRITMHTHTPCRAHPHMCYNAWYAHAQPPSCRATHVLQSVLHITIHTHTHDHVNLRNMSMVTLKYGV